MNSDRILDVANLSVHFNTPEGIVRAVDGISFGLQQGQTLALVGESGCGKSVTAQALLRLLRTPPASIRADSLKYKGLEILNLSAERMRQMRGKEISMIFQEPMTSLNPVFSINMQLSEVYRIHNHMKRSEIRKSCIDILSRVGIADAASKLDSFPHNLSGGLRQRVMIAMALAATPSLMIADEPTTALDVTIQAQILDLLRKLRAETGMALLLITHDFGVVAEMADQVSVMYSGRIVEQALASEVFRQPLHPYTRALIDSIPGIRVRRGERLNTIAGAVPNPLRLPKGCRFAPRCALSDDRCFSTEPELETVGHRSVACYKWEVYS